MINDAIPKIRLILLAIIFLIAGFLLSTVVVPLGRTAYRQDFQNENYQRIGKIKPIERTLPATATGQTILGGPVYFTINQPRKFEQAEVQITYRTNQNFRHAQIELGVLNNKALWQYQLKPIQNTVIERAEKSWSKLRVGNELLLQRTPKYTSIADFKRNPPPFEQIATYQHEWQLEKNFTLPKTGQSEIVWQLQGGYQFFTLVGTGTLEVDFAFSKNPDLTNEATLTEVQLYQGKNLVAVSKLGAERTAGDKAGHWSYNFQAKDLKPGYYKIVLRADNNLITDKLVLNQENISFAGRLKFAKRQAVPVELWTNSREVNLLAQTAESVGDVYLNGQRQLIFEAFKQYSYKNSARTTQIRLTKPGLEIAGDGVFALKENQLFDPRLKQIDSLTDLDKEKIDYILARYDDTVEKDGWKTAKANFDLRGADLDQGAYSFVLSAPGFKADDDKMDWLEIKSIEAELKGDNLWQETKTFVKKVVRKLFFS